MKCTLVECRGGSTAGTASAGTASAVTGEADPGATDSFTVGTGMSGRQVVTQNVCLLSGSLVFSQALNLLLSRHQLFLEHAARHLLWHQLL